MAGDPTLRAIIDSTGAAVGARRFTAACQSMTNSAAGVSRSLLGLNGLFAGLAAGLSTKAFVQAGDAFSMMTARLSMFAQEGVKSTDILQSLLDAANRSRAPVGDMADIYARNAAALNVMGYSTAEQVRLTETLYKSLVISGNATESGKNALIQFSQALNSGVFRGQEFTSVNEQATEILRAMSRATGKTQGELRKLANDGMLTASVATNALLNDTRNIDTQFQQLPQTVEQASIRFSDMFKIVIGESAEATGSNRALAAAINEWTDTLGDANFRSVVDWFSASLKTMAEWGGNVAKELKLIAIEAKLMADAQEKAAERTQTAWDKFKTGAGAVGSALVSPQAWYEAISNVWNRAAGNGIDMKEIREQAKAIAEWDTTVSTAGTITPAGADAPKKEIKFGAGDHDDEKRRERIIGQLNKQIELERISSEIRRAEIAGDTSLVQTLQMQHEIRQKISDEMRKTAPEKAAALEREIYQSRALEIQLKAVQEIQERNTAFARDFADTITSGFAAAVRGGQSFSQTLKQMAVDILDVIMKAAVLEPLGNSIGSSLSKALNGGGGGVGGFDIGNILGFSGGDMGTGSWAPTVTAFASGGVVDRPTGFAFGGGLGVAGEDGPEGILPLSRGRNGDLGVNASGLGNVQTTNVNITITGDATDATVAKMREAAEQMFAQKTPGIVADAVSAVARNHRNNKTYLSR